MGNFQSAENPLGKQEIGDKIFDVVNDLHPEQAEAITGMLLELKEAELRRLLTEEAELHHKIWTAMRALEADEWVFLFVLCLSTKRIVCCTQVTLVANLTFMSSFCSFAQNMIILATENSCSGKGGSS